MQDSMSHQNAAAAGLSESETLSLEQAYDPWSQAHNNNPCPMYSRIRKEEPVFFSPRAQVWVVSRYEDVINILKDHQRYAMYFLSGGASKYTPEVLHLMQTSPLAEATPLPSCDPPVHTRLRSSINRALSAQRVASL
ncbi:MAG TPA: hypothetical protein VH593_27725, partial [Ktedonobacteraceae bacterium]